MNIPMVDLKSQYQALKQEIDSALIDALSATQFILGPNVQAFEQEAADYLGVKHAVGVASGTDALHLALVAAGIGEGDEVITTPFTFIATAEAISTFINDFLGNRLMSNDRARMRYVTATRSFVQWLSRSHLLSEESGQEILEVLRRATRGLSRGEDGPGADRSGGPMPLELVGGEQALKGVEDERYFQVLDNQGKSIVLLDLETADEVRGDSPPGADLEVGDLVAGALTRKNNRPWVDAVRLVAGDDDDEDDELGLDDEWDENGDFFAEDDDWAVASGPLVEDALEILASEDRYAPREVVRVTSTPLGTTSWSGCWMTTIATSPSRAPERPRQTPPGC